MRTIDSSCYPAKLFLMFPRLYFNNLYTEEQEHHFNECVPFLQAVYMIDWCPANTDELLAAKCNKDQSSTASFNYTYLMDVPVVSADSGIIYQNIYCGKCHDEHRFEKYSFDLGCDCEIDDVKYISKLTYQEGNLTWIAQRPHTVRCQERDFINCFLRFEYPNNLGHVCEDNLIDNCSGNQENMFASVLKDGCNNGHVYYVQDNYSNVYKNFNCSLCNGLRLQEISCLLPLAEAFPRRPVDDDFWTLSDLFSIDDHTHCDENYVYDPIFEKCDSLETIIDRYPNTTDIIDQLSNASEYMPTSLGPSPKSTVFLAMMSLSIVCLLLHILLFLIICKDRNLHSLNLFSMSCALFLAETIFVFGANLCDTYVSCYVLSVFVYYFFLAAFLWMNVMSYDICRTFRSREIKSHSLSAFTRYSLYAWGVALLFTLCAVLVDLVASTSKVAPGFADEGFWFSRLGGMLLFFVIPVEILFTVNLAMLIISVIEIRKQKKVGKVASSTVRKTKNKKSPSPVSKDNVDRAEEMKIYNLITGKIKKTAEHHKKDVANLKLYASLAVLMGVPWIFAVLVSVSVVFDYLFNIFNSLQGVFIFLAFDCKKKTLNDLKALCSKKPKSTTTYTFPASNLSSRTDSSSTSNSHSTRRHKKRSETLTSKTTLDTYVSQDATKSVTLGEKITIPSIDTAQALELESNNIEAKYRARDDELFARHQVQTTPLQYEETELALTYTQSNDTARPTYYKEYISEVNGYQENIPKVKRYPENVLEYTEYRENNTEAKDNSDEIPNTVNNQEYVPVTSDYEKHTSEDNGHFQQDVLHHQSQLTSSSSEDEPQTHPPARLKRKRKKKTNLRQESFGRKVYGYSKTYVSSDDAIDV